MSSIGSITFLSVPGALEPLGENVETYVRAGVDGFVARRMGKTNTPVVVATRVDVTDADSDGAELEAHIQSCRDILGTLVTVINDRGTTIDNVLVLRVENIRARPAKKIVGGINVGAGGAGYWVYVDFVLQRTD